MNEHVGQTGVFRTPTDWVASVTMRFRAARRDRLQMALRSSGPTVAERQDELIRFYERYEELVETIVDAAQYGPTAKLERKYAAHREWMSDAYPPVRPFLISFLLRDAEDQAFGEAVSGRPVDAFEALVAAPDLNELLRVDDGGMISRITRTREALTLYGEHLRQLAARGA